VGDTGSQEARIDANRCFNSSYVMNCSAPWDTCSYAIATQGSQLLPLPPRYNFAIRAFKFGSFQLEALIDGVGMSF